MSVESAEENKSEHDKLIETVQEAINSDNQLREKYQVGEKFRFIRDKLHALLDRLEKEDQLSQFKSKPIVGLLPSEKEVYVYLYNAQGAILKNWLNMLTPKVFYEYSVNRPVYAEKGYIESLIRSKSNKVQHGYLCVAVQAEDIIPSQVPQRDFQDNPLIRVKEGALKFGKLISFTHNHHEYVLNEAGELIKKE